MDSALSQGLHIQQPARVGGWSIAERPIVRGAQERAGCRLDDSSAQACKACKGGLPREPTAALDAGQLAKILVGLILKLLLVRVAIA